MVSFSSMHMSASVKNKVFIYSGPGTSKKSIAHTEASLSTLTNFPYKIEYILAHQLILENWESEAILLIIPGGADIPYTKALNGLGNQKIRAYVEAGGSFLGICAGSYYAGEFVDFGKNTDVEVQGVRELAFFPGIVCGPLLAPFSYHNESGARAARIFCDNSEGHEDADCAVYYNGGGYFVDAATKKNTRVIAWYEGDNAKNLPAIIECQVGNGRAILSGVHFEYDPNLLEKDNPFHARLLPSLQASNSKRLQLINQILIRLMT